MKNLKSPLIVLGCVFMLAIAGCRSGNNPPANGSQVTLTLTKSRAAIPGGGFYDGVVEFSVTPGTVAASCLIGTAQCTPTFATGSVVTLSVPAGGVPTGHSFNGWSRPECGSASTCVIPLNSNFSIQAFFGPLPPTVGDVVALTPTGKLVSFNYNEPEIARTSQTISGLGADETIVGIDYQPTLLTNSNPFLSRLIAVTRATGPNAPGRLLEINPATGSVTTAAGALFPPRVLTAAPGDSFTGLIGTQFGVDYNPRTRVIRVVSDAGQNLSIEVGQNVTSTGAAIPGGTVSTDGTVSDPTISGGGTVTGISGAAYTNNYFNPRATLLYVINRFNGKLYVQNNNEGFLYEVATVRTPTGGVPTNISDFDIRGGGVDMTGRDVATVPDAIYISDAGGGAGTGASLYHLNLRNGVSTLISGPVISGQIPVPLNGSNANPLSEGVRSLAIRPIPAPVLGNALAITERNELISFNRETPSTILSRNAIPRLYTSTTRPLQDNLVGFDFRSKNGLLYGVSQQGRVYTINPDSGLGSLVGGLGVTLSGTDFGVDFNPTNGLLRVVSNAGQNLSVNPDTGAATSQATLFRGTSSLARVTASAYSNNLPAAATTMLFGIDTSDTSNAVLVTQNISNNVGQITNVGALGVGATGANGFDIDGLTGSAFAALRGSDSVTRLYRLNLGTGAATSATAVGVSNVVGSGDEPLVGMTLRLPTTKSYALIESGGLAGVLLGFNPEAPAAADFLLGISCAACSASEKLISIDYRASDTIADRAIYAVSTAGRVFRLTFTFTNGTDNPPTAVSAGSPVPLIAVNSPAFVSFGSATDFGSDFRPVTVGATPTLHVVAAGDPAQNIKINILNGSTQRDTNLTINNTGPLPPLFTDACDGTGAPTVGAIAYSNNVSAERLYAINSATACLYVLNSVNGQMDAVDSDQALGATLASAKMALDIVGSTDGQVLAALDIAGDSRSTLYKVNLGSGTVAAVGLIGAAGTGKVISLTGSLKAFNDNVGP